MNPGGHALGRRLSELRAAQRALAAEARAVEADDTYVLLVAGNHFTGATAERARPALALVAELWRCLTLLDDLLGRVERQAEEVQGDDAHAATFGALLNGPVIVVAPDVVAPDVLAPDVVAHADLAPDVGVAALSPSGAWSRPTISPDDLLAALQGALAPVRQVVAEIDAAWRELVPRLDRAGGEAARLAVELPGLDVLVAAGAALDGLPARIVDDPLGAAEELRGIESTLGAVAHARADLARLRQATAAAARTLAELEALVDEGSAALERSRAEVASPVGLLAPVDPDVLSRGSGLRPWLARLERLVSAGDVSRASAGLDRWRALAEQTAAVARQVADSNAGPWRRRQELQGLLRATRVKAGAMGRAEDPLVSELVGQAARSLAAPCDLSAAESAIEALLGGLRERTPSGNADGPAWTHGEPSDDDPVRAVGASDPSQPRWVTV